LRSQFTDRQDELQKLLTALGGDIQDLEKLKLCRNNYQRHFRQLACILNNAANLSGDRDCIEDSFEDELICDEILDVDLEEAIHEKVSLERNIEHTKWAHLQAEIDFDDLNKTAPNTIAALRQEIEDATNETGARKVEACPCARCC
jgi:hypothetical protein